MRSSPEWTASQNAVASGAPAKRPPNPTTAIGSGRLVTTAPPARGAVRASGLRESCSSRRRWESVPDSEAPQTAARRGSEPGSSGQLSAVRADRKGAPDAGPGAGSLRW
ncbi:hypothetical protein LUX33_16465 [Actinomadura madurae]|uniref:hypothetical protein n=1 Tax=Actinomadura madurae TaxID=1993 RepID=UPI0020D251C9|nr:hypothetical protein [Actinomadura madurae]MCP9949835.1 hypothetical protein [Actinomadura madurae]